MPAKISYPLFYALATLFLMIPYVPFSFSELGRFFPEFISPFIFFFYVYFKDRPNYFFIFIIAIIIDALHNMLIGTTTVTCFLSLLLFHYQRKLFYFKEFTEIWISFSFFTMQFTVVNLLIINSANDLPIDLGLVLFKLLGTILLYPLLHNLLLFLAALLKPTISSEQK